MADNVVGGDFDPLSPQVTPGAEAALAGGDDAAAERAKYYRSQRERLERLSTREEELYSKKEAEEAPLRRDLEQSIKQTARTSELATQKFMTNQADLPQFNADSARGDGFQWMSLAAGFGAIAGALSRYHTTTALNAFAAMNTGYAKGQLQVWDQKYQEWQANSERAREYNQRALREYRAVMDNAQLNLDAKSNLMKMTADKWQDQLMSNAAQLRDVERMTQLMTAQDRFDEGLKLRKDAFEQHKKVIDLNMQIRTDQMYGDAQDVDSIKQQVLSLASPPPSPTMQARYPYLRKAMQQVMKEKPNYNPADYYANLQMKKLAATSDITAMRNALTKMTGLQTSISSFEPIAKYNGDILLRLVDKVDASGNTVFNRWINAGRAATGDPDVAQFHQAITAYSNEVARILNNPSLAGTLTVSAQQEVKNWLPDTITASQIKRVVPSLNAEMDYRGNIVNAQVEYLSGSIQNLASGGPRPAPFQPPAAPPPPIPEPPGVEDLYIEQ
jgi:lipopolysaccharide export system protein LptC